MASQESPIPEEVSRKLAGCDRAHGRLSRGPKGGESCNREGWCAACTDHIVGRRLAGGDGLEERLEACARASKGFAILSYPLRCAQDASIARVLDAGRAAIRRSLARALGYTGPRGASDWKSARKQIGAAWRVDPLGLYRPEWDGHSPSEWPIRAPSIDLLVPLVKRTPNGLKPIRGRSLERRQEAAKNEFYARYISSEKIPNVSSYDDPGLPDLLLRLPPPGRRQASWREVKKIEFRKPWFDLRVEPWSTLSGMEPDNPLSVANRYEYPELEELTRRHMLEPAEAFRELWLIDQALNRRIDYMGILGRHSFPWDEA